MLRKSRGKVRKKPIAQSTRSVASSNLSSPVPSTISYDRASSRKIKCSKKASSVATEKSELNVPIRKEEPTLNIPDNTAVHFGQFYGLHKNSQNKSGEIQNNKNAAHTKSSPRMEFTRQMVHKLERSVGTKEYAKQLSEFLDETVEPPDFKLDVPRTENSIPYGKENPSGYPLWYKDPLRMPSTKEKFENKFWNDREYKKILDDAAWDTDGDYQNLSEIEYESEQEPEQRANKLNSNIVSKQEEAKVKELSSDYSSSASEIVYDSESSDDETEDSSSASNYAGRNEEKGDSAKMSVTAC